MIRRPDRPARGSERPGGETADAGSTSGAAAIRRPGMVRPHSARGWIILCFVLLGIIALGAYAILHGQLAGRYSPHMENLALEARLAAWEGHPRYQEGEAQFAAGEVARDAGRIEEAYESFKRAASAFQACETYEKSYELDAAVARKVATALRPEHPVVALGEERWLAAKGHAEAGEFDQAYQLFREAEFYFSYDDSWERDARVATLRANPRHPAYQRAQPRLKEAQALLEKRPLQREDLERARVLFDEAARDLADAMPYDDTIEKVASAARRAAERSSPQWQQAEAAFQKGIEEKTAERYASAYDQFTIARDSFLAICAEYVAIDEEEAERARAEADPSSPDYARAHTPFDEAEEALRLRDYELAYRKFREARELFLRAVNIDSELEAQVRDMRELADPSHPEFAAGEEHMKRALELKHGGDLQGASEALLEARARFSTARLYDPQSEQAALQARDEAWSEMPVTYAAGMAALSEAEMARGDGRIEAAYDHYREARRNFVAARFDPVVLADLEAAKRAGDRSHAEFARGEELELEGRRHLEEGDGRKAETRFEMATISYAATRPPVERTRVPGESPVVDTPGDGPGDRALREAIRNARNARNDASDRKETCDAWRKNGEMNRLTVSYYEAGNAAWEKAEAAYAASDWVTATGAYREALESYLKVSNRSR